MAVELGPVRPRVASAPEMADAAMQRFERTNDLVAEINRCLKRYRLAELVRSGQQVWRFYTVMKPVRTENELIDLVNLLYKMFYEGARTTGKARHWKLPAPLDETYGSSNFVRDVSELRCDAFHDKFRARDAERVGEIYERRVGNRFPRTEAEWTEIADSLLSELETLLDEIYVQLPEVLAASGV